MRSELVGKLVLVVSTLARPSPPIHDLGGWAIACVAKVWLNSRVALVISSLAVGAFAAVLADEATGTFGRQYAVIVLSALLVPALFVLLPWIGLRWRQRCWHASAARALDDLFAQHRPTHEEWGEAKRLIAQGRTDFLRYGMAERYDTMAVG
jgi:hypothetical protein